MQIEKRLEHPNPRESNKTGFADKADILAMAEKLRVELRKCEEHGFAPDDWPVRVTEFAWPDLYNAPQAAPNNLTLLFDTGTA